MRAELDLKCAGKSRITSLDMPRLTLAQQLVEIERETVWLCAVEAGETAVDQIAEAAGLRRNAFMRGSSVPEKTG
jgi:hypothetical protein